jgi:kynurenine formamidase
LPLGRLADVEGLVIDATRRDGRAIGAGYFRDLDLRGRAVLIRTGWDSRWRTPQYGESAPFVTSRAAELLVEAAPALVGIDSVNIDDAQDGSRPAHTLLLGAGIPVVEHLCNLSELPARGFRFPCVPV